MDENGSVIRKLKFAPSKGINRVNWDLRYPSTYPVRKSDNVFANGGSAMMVAPGNYKVSMSLVDGDVVKPLQGPVGFKVKSLDNTSLPAADRNELVAFQAKVQELGRVCQAAFALNDDLAERLTKIRQTVDMTPTASHELLLKVKSLQTESKAIARKFSGDESIAKRNENQPPSISDRLGNLVWGHWRSTSAPTTMMIQGYDIILSEFSPAYDRLKVLIQKDLKAIEDELDSIGAPYTPGRFPELKK
jgi:alpha-D-ribose 1-methylphosphonate 5-triphosphate synthase subunit PhnH